MNLLKNHLGKVSKQLAEKINCDIFEKLQFNQWCNTDVVLKWFNNITDKSNRTFFQFEIKELYPSVTENISHQTLRFVKQHTNIDKNDLRIINDCLKLLLFIDNKTWKNKSTDSSFDVTIVSFHRAGVYKLVGLYIQSKLEKILPKSNFGLY